MTTSLETILIVFAMLMIFIIGYFFIYRPRQIEKEYATRMWYWK